MSQADIRPAADAEIPIRTALYRIFGAENILLYIGISDNFGRRWQQHARKQSWWHEHRRMTVDWRESRPEAEAAEVAAIKAENPRHNKRHAMRPMRTQAGRLPYGVEEARMHLGDIVARVRVGGERIGISRYGKPAAVLVPPDWYAEAQDALSAAHSGAS